MGQNALGHRSEVGHPPESICSIRERLEARLLNRAVDEGGMALVGTERVLSAQHRALAHHR